MYCREIEKNTDYVDYTIDNVVNSIGNTIIILDVIWIKILETIIH